LVELRGIEPLTP